MDIGAVHRQLGYPGLQATLQGVKREAARLGVAAPTRAEVQAVVSRAPQTQVYRPPQSGKAAVWALSLNSYWQCDNLSLENLQGSRNKGYKYVMILSDVYSRFVRAEPLKDKEPKNVAAAFERVLARSDGAKPQFLGLDGGGEWAGPFRAMLDRLGIGLRPKSSPEAMNNLAVVDRAVQTFRSTMMKRLLADNTTIWWNKVQAICDAMNARTNSGTGAPPEAINADDNEVLEHLQDRKQADKLERSVLAYEKQRKGLGYGDSFRAPEKRPKIGQKRTGRPTFGARVYTVKEFKNNGRVVVANEGNAEFPVAQVLPVPAGTQAANFQALRYAERARKAQVSAARRPG